MRAIHRSLLLGCFMLLTAPVFAARHALILCNQNYQAIGALRTTLAEAREAEKTLAGLGFAGNVTVFSDDSTEKLTLMLKGSDGQTFQIQQIKPTKRSVFKPLGEPFDFNRNSGNPRFKIIAAGRRLVTHPVHGAMDVYTVKVFDSVSGKEFQLVQGQETEVP